VPGTIRRLARNLLLVAVLSVLALLVSGCGGIDRDRYVARNVALLNSLPFVPGARATRTDSSPYKNNDTAAAHTIGYGTTRLYRLPRRVTPERAVRFYRTHLVGWKVEDVSAAPSLSVSRGDAYVHVLAGGGKLYVEVDHDRFKGGSSPRCFGP
jgi:hypothetical protein